MDRPRLFSAEYRLIVVVLAAGVALFATNVYVTTTLLPTAVKEIGGQEFYAWAMTVFLLAALLASSLVPVVLQRFGTRTPYALAFFAFAVGSLLCMIAPTMDVLLVGRGVQGLAGGLLTGMAFSLVNTVLPESLWRKAFGLLSAMWGIGNVLGPLMGGLFAQLDLWRGGFGLLVVVAVVLGAIALVKIPESAAVMGTRAVPLASLAMLIIATGTVSMSAFTTSAGAAGVVLVLGVVGLIGFVLIDRRAAASPVPKSLLPKETYRKSSPLPWIYLAIAALCVGSTNETFVPLFGQSIAGMGPLLAGVLGAVYSWGWSTASMTTSGDMRESRIRMLRVLGPSLMTVGLVAYGLLNLVPATTEVVVAWFVVLFIAGAGVGMSFPANATAAMKSTSDPAESAAAAAGVNTVQMMSSAFGAALSGWAVGIAGNDAGAQAWSMSLVLAIVGVMGVGAVLMSMRGRLASLPEVGTELVR